MAREWRVRARRLDREEWPKMSWVGFESFRLINRTVNWYINWYGWLAISVGQTIIMFFVCFLFLFFFCSVLHCLFFFLFFLAVVLSAVLPEEWSITTVATSQCEMKWEQLLKGQNTPQDMWGHLRNSQPFLRRPCKCPTRILKPDLLDLTR